jgi:hypothetical protein
LCCASERKQHSTNGLSGYDAASEVDRVLHGVSLSGKLGTGRKSFIATELPTVDAVMGCAHDRSHVTPSQQATRLNRQ